MTQIGFSLIDATNTEIAQYTTSVSMIVLPNGDHVHSPMPGDTYQQWRFVPRMFVDNPPGPLYASTGQTVSFDGTNVVVTVTYETTPSIIPQSISQRQLRLALLAQGNLPQLQGILNAADQATQITWNYASAIKRNDPLITTILGKLNLTAAQMDTLFQTASAL